jgi:hypothetical protein
MISLSTILNEMGDASAKPYKTTSYKTKIGIGETINVKFKTDSGLNYKVSIENVNKFLEVDFTANNTYDITNSGEMWRVMATVMKIVTTILKNSDIGGIRYIPAGKGMDLGASRDTLYRIFINTYAKRNNLTIDWFKSGLAVHAMFV